MMMVSRQLLLAAAALSYLALTEAASPGLFPGKPGLMPLAENTRRSKSPQLEGLNLRKQLRLNSRGSDSGLSYYSSSRSGTPSVSEKVPELCAALWNTKERFGDDLSSEALQEVLEIVRDYPELYLMQQAPDIGAIRAHAFEALDRAQQVAVFSHSLERNGANIFLRILLAKAADEGRQNFELYSPSDGPMKKDFEAMGVKVNIVDPKEAGYMQTMKSELQRFGAVFANTIMRAEVVRLSQQLGMPYVWVIHEAWPREEFDHYASKVFQQEGINAGIIKEALAEVEPELGTVCFPAKVQQGLYDGLVNSEACKVVYNGIPLDSIDHFKSTKDRKAVRAELGYTDDDFVVLHLGTVCGRKCQDITAQAFSRLVNKDGVKNAKLLMVGARYIRDHEIQFINKVKGYLQEGNVEHLAQILDIQEEVLRFYMAADVVLVPSKNEVLPLVVAEAQAFKKPVVASKIDGIPEALDDGQEGFLIPPCNPDALADAVLKVYKDENLRVQMGERGRKRVETQFSHGGMTAKYQALIDKMAPEEIPSLYSSSDEDTASPINAQALTPTLNTLRESPAQSPEPANGNDPVLVDMDSVLVDWDGAFMDRWLKKHPEDKDLISNRKHFELEKNFPKEKRDEVLSTITEPGMYLAMKPLPGALEALQEMVATGIDVRIVTAPHQNCAATCAAEKFQWVEQHLGADWLSRLILTRDKTHVMGSVLIDDKPAVRGSASPTWDHVLFSQPWNSHLSDSRKRMSSWSQWRSILGVEH